jgi:Tfp pilus assembly protein PilO
MANNVVLLLISRLAMVMTPLVAMALVYLGGFWLTSQFSHQADEIGGISTKVESFESQVQAQAITVVDLKAKQDLTALGATDAVSSLDMWEVSTNSRLDKMTDSISSLSASVAALNASLMDLEKGK